MPLMTGKSEKAFSHNVGAEMDAGKPQKQSLAIAYAMKKKAKKMAMGGETCAADDQPPTYANPHPHNKGGVNSYADGGMVDDDMQDTPIDPKSAADMANAMRHAFHKKGYAEGGEVKPEDMDDDDDKAAIPASIAGAYARGGEIVDRIMKDRHPDESEDNLAGFSPNEFDEMELDPMDTQPADYTGANSGDEIGNEQKEEDEHDIVARAIRAWKMKDRNPRMAG